MTNYEYFTIAVATLTAIASMVAAVSVFIASKHFKLATLAHSAEHERSRRERAIEVVKNWSKYLDKVETSARKFIESLTVEDCRKIQSIEEMWVKREHEFTLVNALANILDQNPLVISEDKRFIVLNKTQVGELLSLSLKHLNRLEISLLYHMNGVADKEIMEYQFKYLINPRENIYVLEQFREEMGSKATYPAIDNFVNIKKAEYLKNHPVPRKNVDAWAEPDKKL